MCNCPGTSDTVRTIDHNTRRETGERKAQASNIQAAKVAIVTDYNECVCVFIDYC